MTTALCISGAGSKGIIINGMLQYIHDTGVKFDAIYGSSSGALNGLKVAQGDWEGMNELWLSIKNKDVYTVPWCRDILTITSTKSIYDTKPLHKLLQDECNKCPLLDTPFYINTSNYSDNSITTFISKTVAKEDLATVLLASASVPVFFPPVDYKGMTLVDGGVFDDYSIMQAVERGHTTIISLTILESGPLSINNLKDSIANVSGSMLTAQYWSQVNSVKFLCPDINLELINISSPMNMDILDFEYTEYNRQDLIDLGYNAARDILCKN